VSTLKIKIRSKNMLEKTTSTPNYSFSLLIVYGGWSIHNIISTAPQLSISQKALGTFPEDGNVMPIHVGATIHN
jgi:hypothetical protein